MGQLKPAAAYNPAMLADHLVALHSYQDVFLTTIPEADPTTPVPWCGRWKAQDLVIHLARIHHWAAAQARREPEIPLGRGPFDLEQLYAQCAAELRETLAELDPDARAWTLLDDGLPRAEQTGTVRFWHRRQALETLVHTWDLRVAIGLDSDPGPKAWLDCLDEVVTIMHPRQVRLGRIERPRTPVRFIPDESDQRWDLVQSPQDKRGANVAGPAKSLALLVWGRTALDDPSLTVRGDADGLAEVLASGLTP